MGTAGWCIGFGVVGRTTRWTRPLKTRALSLCRKHYAGFGPTLAAEKLSEEHDLPMSVETLRGLLLAEGLWVRKRHRDKHRARRERRSCFGEMVQADASEHDWLEGRGPMLTLVGMIDDATDRIVCRFVESETTEAYMEVLGRWIGKHGRRRAGTPTATGSSEPRGRWRVTMGKGLFRRSFRGHWGELGMELILAGSPQAKGVWSGCGARRRTGWSKSFAWPRRARSSRRTWCWSGKFMPWFNRRCTHEPASANDAHKPLGKRQDPEAILSIQEARVVANDYTVRFGNQVYQLLPPAWPGLRKGKVIVEKRADGSMKIRFKGRYLEHRAVEEKKEGDGEALGAPPPSPRSLAREPIPAGVGQTRGRTDESDPACRTSAAGRSGRTPAEPCTPAAVVVVAAKKRGVQRQPIHGAEEPDIPTLEKHRTFLLWFDRNWVGFAGPPPGRRRVSP